MNKVIFFISILLFGIVNSNPLFGQKKSELLKKQEKILLEKIEHTKVLIDQTRATKKLTLSEINIVNRHDSKSDEVLGVHMIAPRAADLIMEAVVAMEYRASAEDIARICHPHPTYSEAVKEAALAATENRPLHI